MSATTAASIKAWVLASRPKTLFAAVAPVLLGSALAFSQSKGNLPAALAALFGAICIQIATNLANDYWDAKKGADTSERLGPVRVTASGLLKPRTVFLGMVFIFLLATAAGVFLTLRAGWPVVAIGLASILFGILYTAGPFSLAYLGLGEVFTFLFFGLVATVGTYFVQALSFSPDALWLGVMPGSYSVVLIALNNLRDREKKNARRPLRRKVFAGRNPFLPFCAGAGSVVLTAIPWRRLVVRHRSFSRGAPCRCSARPAA